MKETQVSHICSILCPRREQFEARYNVTNIRGRIDVQIARNIYEWSNSIERGRQRSSPPPKYCSTRLVVKVAIHSFETPRACGCVYFSEDRVEHAPTHAHILGLATHAAIRRRNRRRSIIRRSALAAASDDRMNGEYSPNIRTPLPFHAAARTKLFCSARKRSMKLRCQQTAK